MKESESPLTLVKGHILTFPDVLTSVTSATAPSISSTPEGALIVRDGMITAVGDIRDRLIAEIQVDEVVDYGDNYILPGFIDLHNHYPQTDIIGSYSGDLLHWLNTYTFPEESRFHDRSHADHVAERYFDTMIRNGTTCAMSFCTSHPTSVDAAFSAAARRRMRFYAGKVMMDREAPDALCDIADQSYHDSKRLAHDWHLKDRLTYVVTPRFAITSTPAQLEAAAQLLADFPDAKLQSHLSENHNEIAFVLSQYPEAAHYTDIYLKAGLLGTQCFYGHGIHLSEDEWQILHDTGTRIVHCPTSNNFLGSGQFDLATATNENRPVDVGLATDIGGGSSFSMLATMKAAYEVARLKGHALQPEKAFWMATRGNALMLDPEARFGTLASGFEADFCVLDAHATSLLRNRVLRADNIQDVLFSFMMFGDDRCIRATWVAGCCLYDNQRPIPVRRDEI